MATNTTPNMINSRHGRIALSAPGVSLHPRRKSCRTRADPYLP
jgi:hypothetical protein